MKKSIRKVCSLALLLTTTTAAVGTGVVGLANTLPYDNNKTTVFADQAENTITRFEIASAEASQVVGSTYTIPEVYFVNAGTRTKLEQTHITVTDSIGREVEVTEGTFKIENIGEYTITFKYTVGDVEYVSQATVQGKIGTTSIELKENSKRFLPNKVWKSYTGKLYVPEVFVEFADDEMEYVIETTVTNKDHQEIAFDSQTGEINYGTLQEGTYNIKYTAYTKAENASDRVYLCTKSVSFEVLADAEYSSDYTLKYDYDSSFPTAADIGDTITLPAPIGKRSDNSEEVPVYYTVEAWTYENGKLVNVSDQVYRGTKVIEGNKFTANKAGTYVFYYNVSDALGKTAERSGFTISEVGDTTKPEIKVVDAYTVPTSGEPTTTDATHKLQSYFENGKNIVIKAIYAEDKANGLADLKLARTIYADNQTTTSGKKYSDEDTGNTSNFNKDLVFNLDTSNGFVFDENTMVDAGDLADGSYTVYYKATDASGNSQSESYTFTVKSDFQFTQAAKVEFKDTFPTSVQSGEKIEFTAPVANDEYQDRLNTWVEYRYDNDAADAWTKLELEEDATNYVLTANKSGATKVIIRAVAENGATEASGFKYGYSEEVSIKITNNSDQTPLELTSMGDQGTYTQNVEATLPSITITDEVETISYLNVKVEVKHIETEQLFDVYDAVSLRTSNVYKLQDAKFFPTLSGKYLVTYTAKDAGGNQIVAFQNITVDAKTIVEEPRFGNLPESLSSGTLELGESISLPTPDIKVSDGVTSTYSVSVKGPADHEINLEKFTPNVAGTYTIVYSLYIDENGGTDYTLYAPATREFKVTVKDTTAPQIRVEWNLNDSYEKGSKVLIPVFGSSDLSGINLETSKVTITSKSFSRTVYAKDFAAELDKYAQYLEDNTKQTGNLFVPFNYNEEYTITYTVYDKSSNANSVTETHTIKVGDLVAPVMKISDDVLKVDNKVVTTKVKIDSVLSIDMSQIKEITDNKTEGLTNEDVKVVVKNTNTGLEVENIHKNDNNGEYEFNITSAGEYEVTFTVEDEAGNKKVITRTFNVDEASTSSVDATGVIGIVLIVVSVLVLGGVIVYFIVSKKKIDKMYK